MSTAETREPAAAPEPSAAVRELIDFLAARRTLVLSGAGISTDSGIPDYRGPSSIKRPRRPIQYKEFIQSPETRARYWARSLLGWPRILEAQPNDGHRALASLERSGLVTAVITQNVDRLHQAAGSRTVLELHGALAEVHCLQCGAVESRDELQEKLFRMNPTWTAEATEIAPDGDAELPPELTRSFRVPVCSRCDGMLKPGVVFFGESVPKTRVVRAWELLSEAEALLVAGSSLTVFSGFRFVDRAWKDNKPVAIINRGETRGDALAAVRIDAGLSRILPHVAAALAG